jgi:lipoprotein-releasing system permease protein
MSDPGTQQPKAALTASYHWLLARRYFSSRNNPRLPSLTSTLSILAVALGVTAMIIVLAVMGGFENDLRDKIVGTKAHVLVSSGSGDDLGEVGPLLAAIRTLPEVKGASAYLESDMMMSSNVSYSGIVLRGIDWKETAETSGLLKTIRAGEISWLDNPDKARRRQLWPPPSGSGEGSGSGDGSGMENYRRLRQRADEAMKKLEAANEELEKLRLRMEGRAEASGSAEAEASGAMPPLPGMEQAEMPSLPGMEQGAMPPLPGTEQGAMPPLPGMEQRAEPSTPPVSLPGCAVGTELADALGLDVGDAVNLIDPEGDIGPTGFIPRSRPFRVVAIFYTGLYEYDSRLVFTKLDVARGLLRVGPEVASGVEVRGQNLDDATALRDAVSARIAGLGRTDLKAADWKELNRNLFQALRLEKIAMYFVMSITIVVASFAVVCVLLMIVIEKRREIAIVKSMGAGAADISLIFRLLGGHIAIIGTAVGLGMGLLAILYLMTIGIPLDSNVYYIDRLPVSVEAVEIIAVVVAALLLGFAATIQPAREAARLDPVSALRHDD